MRDLRAPRAVAAEDDCGGADDVDAAAAEVDAGPGVLREVCLHGITRASQLWDLERALAPPSGTADVAEGVDVVVTAKSLRSGTVSPALLGVLRAQRVGLRELVVEDMDADDVAAGDESPATTLADALNSAGYRHRADNAAAAETTPPPQQSRMLMPPAAVPVPEPPRPLAGAVGLTSFSFASCDLGPMDTCRLLLALPVGCPRLEMLNCSDNNLNVPGMDDDSLASLFVRLLDMPALREIVAERCGLDDRYARALAYGLTESAGPFSYNACRKLFLAHNAIGDAGAEFLATALRSPRQPALEELDLSENVIGARGGAALAAALASGGALRDVRAYGNCGGGAEGVAV